MRKGGERERDCRDTTTLHQSKDLKQTVRGARLTDLLYDAVVCEGCASSVHLAKTSLVDQLTDGLQVRVAAL